MKLVHILGGNGSGKSTAVGFILQNDPIVRTCKEWTTLESKIRLVGKYGITADGRSSGGAENIGNVDRIKEILLHLENSLAPSTTVVMEGMVSVSQPIAEWMVTNNLDVRILYLRCNPLMAHERVRLRMQKPDNWDSYAVKRSHVGRNPNCLNMHLKLKPETEVRELLIDQPQPDGSFITLTTSDVKHWVARQVYDLANKPVPGWVK